MSKWLGIKTEVINLRSLLINYKRVIPKPQLPRFEKDLDLLFERYQSSENAEELEKIKKLAKTKLNSMIRVYGELKEEETTIDKEFLDKKSQEYAENMIKNTANSFNSSSNESIDYSNNSYEDYNRNLEKLKKAHYFNKDLVNKAHKEMEDYHSKVFEALKIADQQALELRKKEYQENKEESMEKYKIKLRQMVEDLCVKKEIGNVRETLESIDFDKMAKQILEMELNPEKNPKDSNSNDSEDPMLDILSSFENILSGCMIIYNYKFLVI